MGGCGGGAGSLGAFPVSCSVDKWGLGRFLKDQGLAKEWKALGEQSAGGGPGHEVGKCAEPRKCGVWEEGESGEGVKPGT